MSHDESIAPIGGSFEDLLNDEGIRDEVYGEAQKRVFVYQLEQAIKARKISKVALAKRMRTSRTQVKRVFDPHNVAVSLQTLDAAARSVGKRLQIEIVDG